MTYSPEALAALDAIIASAFDGADLPELSDAVYDELDAACDLDALAQLEEEHDTAPDWADPDSFDAELELWTDVTADPYDRGGDHVDTEERCEFMLGSHRPSWLFPRRLKKDGTPYARGRDRKPAGTLFVSYRQAVRRETAYPQCDTEFVLDSGGFSYLKDLGHFPHDAREYATRVEAIAEQTGTLRFACIQDWMCESKILEKTGLTIRDHQELSVLSYLELCELAPGIKWLPALQGDTVEDYLAHLALYAEYGVDLRKFERVAIGSVCRRQSTEEIVELVETLAAQGLRLHGLGVKSLGLARVADLLVSSDSLAWSLAARKQGRDQNSQHEAEAYRVKMEDIVTEREDAAIWGM